MSYLLISIALLCLLILIYIGIVERHRVLLTKKQFEGDDSVSSGEWIASIIDNEISAPLSIVSGHLKCVMNDHDLPKPVEKDIQTAQETVRQIEHFVAEIRAFRLYHQPDFSPKLEPIQLKELLEQTVHEHRRRALSKGLTFDLSIDATIVHPVIADYALLEQMINSIVTNSVTYTNDGTVTVFAYRNEEHCYIGVKDTGPGISQEDIQRYFYSDTIEPHLSHGHGALGILLVRKAAELLGGKVLCESEQGSGTEVKLSLPLAETHLEQPMIHIEEVEEEVSLDDLF